MNRNNLGRSSYRCAVEQLEDRLVPDSTGFLRSLYAQVLHRAGTTAEINAFIKILDAGAPRDQIVASFIHSVERNTVLVDGIYEQILHRPADAAGQAAWVAQLQAGASAIDVQRQFFTSPEYTSNHLSDAAYVGGLYADVLDRLAEPAGQAFWELRLATGTSRALLAQGFLTSFEQDHNLADRLYQDILLRDGTAAELQFQTNGLQAGVTFNALLGLFFNSIEHRANLESGIVSSTPTLVGPVVPQWSDPAGASFIDPTASLVTPGKINLAPGVYVGPFATLDASQAPISIGLDSNAQDNVSITASGTGIAIGDNVILAHGVTVQGQAKVGKAGGGKPSFVSFNAFIDGATIEEDVVVSALARVAPGIVVHSGTAVIAGKLVSTQAEADDPKLGKVTAVTAGDRQFMADVLHVNEAFASGYTNLFYNEGFGAVRGIGPDPGESDFNPHRDLPEVGGLATSRPTFRNRIIGDVTLADSVDQLNTVLGNEDSIRADEGEPFAIGTIAKSSDRFTFHALEHTEITAGNNNSYGFHSIIHGGQDDGNVPRERTTLGDNITVKDWAVVFRSTIGSGSTIGFRALIDGSQLAPGTVVPDRAVIVDNVQIGTVEW